MLSVVAPALVVVSALSVAATAHVLRTSDEQATTARAATALRALRAERAEGDDVASAMTEVLTAADAEEIALLLQPRDAPPQGARRAMPKALTGTKAGECRRDLDSFGETWLACALDDGAATALAAVPITAHVALIRTLTIATALGLALVLLAVVWAVGRAVRGPTAALSELVAWSETIADAAPTSPPPSSDTEEIARLSASFEALVHRLFETLGRERAQSAHMAHELRTPLTAIVAELEAMEALAAIGASAADGELAAPLARVRSDVMHLSRVINAILVLSRPNDGKGGTILNLADLARELAPKGARVEAPDEALLEGDPALLKLAIENLLDNAQKYAGRPARVVRVSRQGDQVLLTVIDDGPGLDEAARARMFDRYFRAASDIGGSGLGLALVRAVAERHGGGASAAPNPEGPGLSVTFRCAPLVGWHESREG